MLPQISSIPTTNFIILILLLLSKSVFSYDQVCDPQDESSLLAFSENISASPPLNWSSSTSCCQWEGVDCDTNGRVITLQLYYRGLKGVISATISNLVSLTYLNLSNNDLNGPLDEGIIRLINLTTIDLSANTISGFIPQEIGNISHLQKLHLQNNNLSGPIPSSLMSCTNLTDLLLSHNHLDGDISKLDMSKLVQLRKFDLMNNSFTGTLPESIYSCKSLVAIQVEANNITGQISPEIVDFKSLSYFALSRNSFTNITKTLEITAKCSNITALFLESNFYGEPLPSNGNFLGYVGFPSLQYFSLNGNNLTGFFPEWLSNIKTLRALDLSKNNFTGKIPAWLGSLPNLFFLELGGNQFYGEIPQELCRLPALLSKNVDPKLTRLHLELPFYSLKHRSFEQYTTFPTSLLFAGNKLSGQIPSEIGQLQGLQQIRFATNYFSGEIPPSISNLTNLLLLRLGKNNLTGEIPESLTNLHFLEDLDLSYNDLEGPIPTGGQFNTFEEMAFEGNPRLCGEVIHRSCKNTTKQEDGDFIKTENGKRGIFLQGFYVGLASGFSCILVILVSCVWFMSYKRKPPSRTRQPNSIYFTCSM